MNPTAAKEWLLDNCEDALRHNDIDGITKKLVESDLTEEDAGQVVWVLSKAMPEDKLKYPREYTIDIDVGKPVYSTSGPPGMYIAKVVAPLMKKYGYKFFLEEGYESNGFQKGSEYFDGEEPPFEEVDDYKIHNYTFYVLASANMDINKFAEALEESLSDTDYWLVKCDVLSSQFLYTLGQYRPEHMTWKNY